MKIVAHNHAAQCQRSATRPDSDQAVMLDALGSDLRGLYADAAADLPENLLALALRLDGESGPRARAA